MKPWTLAPSLVTLLGQVNDAAPERSKASDGSIGDAAHSSRKSDHNPDENGVVCAVDITHDPENGCDANAIAESLRLSRDRRIKYVIWNRRIFSSSVLPWKWRDYAGAPHDKHVHVSVYSDREPWKIGG